MRCRRGCSRVQRRCWNATIKTVILPSPSYSPLSPTKLRSLTSPQAPVYGVIRFLGFLCHPHFIRKPVIHPGVSQSTNRVAPLLVGCLGLASLSSSQTQSLWGDGLPPGRGTREDILTVPSTATQHTCCISLSGVQHSSPNSVRLWCWPALCKGRTGRRQKHFEAACIVHLHKF